MPDPTRTEMPESYDPDPDFEGDDVVSGFTDEASPDDYPAALAVAARVIVNMDQAAREDAKIIAVSTGGRVQIIGTGKRWPSSDMVLVEGPCILIYGKDAIAAAATLQAPR